jgi:hypothetical protein
MLKGRSEGCSSTAQGALHGPLEGAAFFLKLASVPLWESEAIFGALGVLEGALTVLSQVRVSMYYESGSTAGLHTRTLTQTHMAQAHWHTRRFCIKRCRARSRERKRFRAARSLGVGARARATTLEPQPQRLHPGSLQPGSGSSAGRVAIATELGAKIANEFGAQGGGRRGRLAVARGMHRTVTHGGSWRILKSTHRVRLQYI